MGIMDKISGLARKYMEDNWSSEEVERYISENTLEHDSTDEVTFLMDKKSDEDSNSLKYEFHKTTGTRTLSDEESDDGAHFTLPRFSGDLHHFPIEGPGELHATFSTKESKKSVFINDGLAGLTQFEWLKNQPGSVQRSTLDSFRTKDPTPRPWRNLNPLVSMISSSDEDEEEEEKPDYHVMALKLMAERYDPLKSSKPSEPVAKYMTTGLTNFPSVNFSDSDSVDKYLDAIRDKMKPKPVKVEPMSHAALLDITKNPSLIYNQHHFESSQSILDQFPKTKTAPVLPKWTDLSQDEYNNLPYFRKLQADILKKHSNTDPLPTVTEQIIFEKNMPKVEKAPSISLDLPGVTRELGLPGSGVRSYSPGEYMAIRGF